MKKHLNSCIRVSYLQESPLLPQCLSCQCLQTWAGSFPVAESPDPIRRHHIPDTLSLVSQVPVVWLLTPADCCMETCSNLQLGCREVQGPAAGLQLLHTLDSSRCRGLPESCNILHEDRHCSSTASQSYSYAVHSVRHNTFTNTFTLAQLDK